MQVHHAGQGGGEPHAVGDGPVPVQPHHLVLLRHVMEKTENVNNYSHIIELIDFNFRHLTSDFNINLFLSLAKKVSGTQIFSAKSPESVKTLFSSEEKASLSSFQY